MKINLNTQILECLLDQFFSQNTINHLSKKQLQQNKQKKQTTLSNYRNNNQFQHQKQIKKFGKPRNYCPKMIEILKKQNTTQESQGLLLILQFQSIIGSDDKWACETESANNKGHYICVEMRRTMNCKTISGPLNSEIFLKVKKNLQASAITE